MLVTGPTCRSRCERVSLTKSNYFFLLYIATIITIFISIAQKIYTGKSLLFFFSRKIFRWCLSFDAVYITKSEKSKPIQNVNR